MYDVIGNYPAPSFFAVNSTTGAVSIKQDLKLDVNANTLYTVSKHSLLKNYKHH